MTFRMLNGISTMVKYVYLVLVLLPCVFKCIFATCSIDHPSGSGCYFLDTKSTVCNKCSFDVTRVKSVIPNNITVQESVGPCGCVLLINAACPNLITPKSVSYFNVSCDQLHQDIIDFIINNERCDVPKSHCDPVMTPAPNTPAATPSTPAPTPDTLAPTPDIQTPAPDTLAPTPDTLAPTPDTLAPTPGTLAPTPDTLAPTSDTRVPTPNILAPTPGTPAPTPGTPAPNATCKLCYLSIVVSGACVFTIITTVLTGGR